MTDAPARLLRALADLLDAEREPEPAEPERALVDVITRDVLAHYRRRYTGPLSEGLAGVVAVNAVRRAHGLAPLDPGA